MIDTLEYYRFQRIEALLLQRFSPYPGTLLVDFRTREVVLDGQIYLVKDCFGKVEFLDFFVHPKFGVVKSLDMGEVPNEICKSELCERLEKEIFG